MIVKIIQMTYVRSEIIQNKPKLSPCLHTVYGFKRVNQFCWQRGTAKIHIAGVGIDVISNTTVFMLHSKILYVMSLTL